MQGSPFNLTLNITLKDANGDTISWGDADEFIPLVEGLPRWSPTQVVEIASLEPTVDNPEDGVITLAWSTAQTQALSEVASGRWAFSMLFEEEGGPFALVGGSIAMADPTVPGSYTGMTESLTVNIGNLTASVTVTIGGSGGGGSALKDPGFVIVYPSGGIEIDTPAVFIAPQHQDGDGFSSSQPFEGSDWRPLQVIGAGNLFGVFIDSELTADADTFDTVDISGELVVWDQAGTNVLAAAFSMSGVNSGTGSDTSVKVTLTQVIGSDLSVVDPGIVQSVAGGSYNILITAVAEWD